MCAGQGMLRGCMPAGLKTLSLVSSQSGRTCEPVASSPELRHKLGVEQVLSGGTLLVGGPGAIGRLVTLALRRPALHGWQMGLLSRAFDNQQRLSGHQSAGNSHVAPLPSPTHLPGGPPLPPPAPPPPPPAPAHPRPAPAAPAPSPAPPAAAPTSPGSPGSCGLRGQGGGAL